jgi:hypothetical protein
VIVNLTHANKIVQGVDWLRKQFDHSNVGTETRYTILDDTGDYAKTDTQIPIVNQR